MNAVSLVLVGVFLAIFGDSLSEAFFLACLLAGFYYDGKNDAYRECLNRIKKEKNEHN